MCVIVYRRTWTKWTHGREGRDREVTRKRMRLRLVGMSIGRLKTTRTMEKRVTVDRQLKTLCLEDDWSQHSKAWKKAQTGREGLRSRERHNEYMTGTNA